VERGGSTHTSSKYLGRSWCAKTRVHVCVRGDLINLLECADECEGWTVSASSDSNFCVYRDDVAHAHSLARRTEGRLDASTGRGCVFIAQLMESRWRAREEACRLQARGNNDARSVNWLSRSESS
jgi:hypothetical protein